MAEAKVDSLDALKVMKLAMLKFGDGANVALGEAEAEVLRVMNWLETEQTTYWQMQHRKREELVGRCKEAVRMKKVFKDSSGRQQSAIEEEKALKKALRLLEESEQKIVAVRKSILQMKKEYPVYKGTVQRFATDVAVEVPAAAQLEGLLTKLEAYASLSTPTDAASTVAIESTDVGGAEVSTQSMARAVDEEPATKPESEETKPD